MAYINGKEILFSPVVNLTNGEGYKEAYEAAQAKVEELTRETDILNAEIDEITAEKNALIDDYIAMLQSEKGGEITIPKEVKKLRSYAFYRNTTLSGVELHDLVTSIDDYAFGYTGIKNIIIPNSVYFIGKYCFRDCTELESVKMSKKVNNIATSTFNNCENCIRYDFTEHESVPTLANIDAFNKISDNAEIVIPYNLYSEWRAATNWASLASHIITKATPEQVYFTPSNDISTAAKVGEGVYETMYFGGEEGLTFGKRYIEYFNGETKEIYELSDTGGGALVTLNGSWASDMYTENGKVINGSYFQGDITCYQAGTYRFYQRFIDSRGAEFSTAAYVFEVTE